MHLRKAIGRLALIFVLVTSSAPAFAERGVGGGVLMVVVGLLRQSSEAICEQKRTLIKKASDFLEKAHRRGESVDSARAHLQEMKIDEQVKCRR